MGSPFAAIRRWFSQVLDLASRGVEALEGILGRISALIDAVNRFESQESTQPDSEHRNHMNVLEAKLADLTLAVSEGVNNVRRSERRVQAIVQSARRQLADDGYQHAGLEAEAGQLRQLDADSGDGEPVPAVPERVDGLDPNRPSVIPGVTVGQMRMAQARRR